MLPGFMSFLPFRFHPRAVCATSNEFFCSLACFIYCFDCYYLISIMRSLRVRGRHTSHMNEWIIVNKQLIKCRGMALRNRMHIFIGKRHQSRYDINGTSRDLCVICVYLLREYIKRGVSTLLTGDQPAHAHKRNVCIYNIKTVHTWKID